VPYSADPLRLSLQIETFIFKFGHSVGITMFTNKRIIKGQEYSYLEHSFRTGAKVQKASFYLPKGKQFSVGEFIDINKKIIDKVAKERTQYIEKNTKFSKFFRYGTQIYTLERDKLLFQVFFKKLPNEEQTKIMDVFLRTFLVNSMEMEGGTISYEIAKALDERKNIDVSKINALDIPLYHQLKQAHDLLSKMRLRHPKQIKALHSLIYRGIFPFAGQFRKNKVTFGDMTELAITSDPEKIQSEYKKAINEYYSSKNKVFDFERITLFHKDYQAVHGFSDGNSRLGRLIMVKQLLDAGYPPLLVRGSSSRAYRTSLVAAINRKENTALLKFFYSAYKRTYEKFWLPSIEEAFRRNFAKM